MVKRKNDDFIDDDDYDEDDEDTQKNKYLTFHLAGEEYGIDIKNVTEIIGIQKITDVPDMADFIRGVINLRGKVIPVMDVRLRFKIEFKEYDERTCIIVVNMEGTTVGLVVDKVSEVLDIPEDQIEDPPKAGKGKSSRFLKGLGKVEDEVKILLQIDKLLYENELEQVKDTISREV